MATASNFGNAPSSTNDLAVLFEEALAERARGNIVTAREILDVVLHNWLCETWCESCTPDTTLALAEALRTRLVLSKWQFATIKEAIHGPRYNVPSHVDFLADVVKAFCLRGGDPCRT